MYARRVVKRRPASLTEVEWVQAIEAGRNWSPGQGWVEGRQYPPPDVHDLVLLVQLDRLRWRCEALCMALQKPSVNGALPGQSSVTVEQGKLLASYSSIWEFLTATSWSDGTSRVPGSLSLKLTSGSLQVTLTDPSTATYCSRSGSSLDDILTALELGFLEGDLTWRRSSYATPKKAKN